MVNLLEECSNAYNSVCSRVNIVVVDVVRVTESELKDLSMSVTAIVSTVTWRSLGCSGVGCVAFKGFSGAFGMAPAKKADAAEECPMFPVH